MFWFSNKISCFTLFKISCSEYSSPSAVPQTALVQITLGTTFARSPSYLPLRICLTVLYHCLGQSAIVRSGPRPARDQIWVSSIHAEHLFALEVVVIGNQLTYLEARFYNSNCSKPNGSASPFGDAQLDSGPQRCHEARALEETFN